MRSPLDMLTQCDHRFCIHGLAVQLDCRLPSLNWPVQHALGAFATTDWPEGFTVTPGTLEPYEETTVLRHLSPQAVPVADGAGGMEIYEHGQRFWLVDDRWGLCEINLVTGEWHSWVLPRPALDTQTLIEHAVLWPIAQMLRPRGLWLVPAVSIMRDGVGCLILCPFNLEPELKVLAEHGWKVIGARWTALREEDDRVALLHLPGTPDKVVAPRLNTTPEPLDTAAILPTAYHSFCDAVVTMDTGRRPSASIQPVARASAVLAMKKAWPILELTGRHNPTMAARLASEVPTFSATLSRDPNALLALLDRVTRNLGKLPAPMPLDPRLTPPTTRPKIPA
jgi:hypothetical protein